jgi:hypothetical protein
MFACDCAMLARKAQPLPPHLMRNRARFFSSSATG